ncbi:DUF2970 domain-containing protein [bacterium]|nr:DUF2970 domain-containing protein [bacterium]
MTDKKQKDNKSISLLSLLLSAVAAAFGVQSSKNHERDFTKGHIIGFIVAGFVLTIGIIFSIALLVQFIVR